MPELPEVEVVRAGLEPAVAGASILGVEVIEPRSLKRHGAERGAFETLLTGRRIVGAVRRGKFLWLPLDDGDALLAHLGMSGQLLLRTPDVALEPLLRIRLLLEHPAHGEIGLHFVDQRIFGSMAVDRMLPTPDGAPGGFGADVAAVPSQVAHIARDPLDPAFDEGRFFAELARRKSGIKRSLLDQGLISGIGNIYADEALWAARLHYDTPAMRLARPRARQLLFEVRSVLQRALAEGGTSFDRQYVNVNGASGYFSRSLNVYGREGLPCPRCGTLIVREPFMNRSSHRCPRCQPRPRAQTAG